VWRHDLFPHNVLVDRDGRVATLLDWGHAMRRVDADLALARRFCDR
jgi:Ser/Thr protein kinase RdoA (MazF antagonist)